jgi:isopenicillin N synthase-like dioxygenase
LDPRVSESQNDHFLSLLEDYFGQDEATKREDTRAEYGFQVGVTPGGTEIPICATDSTCQDMAKTLTPVPQLFSKPDPKWRFMWRIGPRPTQTEYPELNAAPVIPKAFPQWSKEMNAWGSALLQSVHAVAELLAIGLGLPRTTFTEKMVNGAHMLAPTGSDLSVHGELGTILAGFHSDLDFLTIHGRSRFPGLEIWDAQGQGRMVKIPPGCLLLQAGMQCEYLTGGLIKAGYHQVTVLPQTLEAIQIQKEKQRPLWRVSSTLFSHIASDQVLEPLEGFESSDYPAITTGKFVQHQLSRIGLLGER